VKLRRASVEDAAKLSLLGGASFLESFADDHDGDLLVAHVAQNHSVDYYTRLLGDADTAAWIVEHEAGAPIGYATAGPSRLPETDAAHDFALHRLYLLSRWHRTGFGRALYDAVETEARARGARRLVLSVYTENEKALRFYRARGFQTIGSTAFPPFPDTMRDHIMAVAL
jgi:diamine N-acetyltransferase